MLSETSICNLSLSILHAQAFASAIKRNLVPKGFRLRANVPPTNNLNFECSWILPLRRNMGIKAKVAKSNLLTLTRIGVKRRTDHPYARTPRPQPMSAALWMNVHPRPLVFPSCYLSASNSAQGDRLWCNGSRSC